MNNKRGDWVALCLISIHLLLSLAYSVLNPLGEAPDEADHWAYVVYLATERRLPEGGEITQSKHPPLYHIGAAAMSLLAEPSFDFLRANPDVQLNPQLEGAPNFFIHTQLEDWPWQGGVLAFHLARLWSVLLNTLTVGATYLFLRRALPTHRPVVLTATAILAFLPEFAFIGGALSNDNAAAFCGTAALWGAIAIFQSGGYWRAGWWTGLALGLGMLSKTSTLSLWPMVGLAFLWGVLRQPGESFGSRSTWLRLGQGGFFIFMPASVLVTPWLWRNQSLYGDPLGMNLVRETIDLRMTDWTWSDSIWLVSGWFYSFWGKFGGAGHIPMAGWVYGLLAVLSMLAGIGLIRTLMARQWQAERPILMLCLLALLTTATGIWRYSLIALGTDQGRLLFPAVAAIVTLFAIGLLSWWRESWRGRVAVGLSLGMAALGLYGLLSVLWPTFAPPRPPGDVPQLAATQHFDFGDVSLIGWQLEREPVLYWQADATPSQDLRVILRVVAADGSLAWEWRRSPAAGRWSTDRWSNGVVVRDVYQVRWPEWAASGRYLVEVAVYPFAQEPILPTQDGTVVSTAAHPYVTLGSLEKE